MSRILESADPETCAAIMKGSRPRNLEGAISRLHADEIEQFFDIVYDSMLAEVRQLPSPGRAPLTRVNRAFQALADRLPAADADLLINVMNAPGLASAEDACLACRLLHTELINLPEPHRSVLARALVTPE